MDQEMTESTPNKRDERRQRNRSRAAALFKFVSGSVLAVACSSAPAAQLYRVALLDELPGSEFAAFASINNHGAVVGWTKFTTGGYEATLWTGATPVGLGHIPGSSGDSFAADINDAGAVVGNGNGVPPSNVDSVALLWHSGTVSDLSVPTGFVDAQALVINNSSVIAGFARTDDARRSVQGFVWDSDTVTEIPFVPQGINELDVIIGRGPGGGATRAVLWDQGSIQTLEPLSGDASSFGEDINDAGSAVGSSGTSDVITPVRWENGIVDALPLPAGTSIGAARSINNDGDSVGFADEIAVLWQDGGVHILDSLIDPEDPLSGIRFYGALDINDHGQILVIGGEAMDPGFHGYVLTPVPLPAAIWLFVSAIALVFRGRHFTAS